MSTSAIYYLPEPADTTLQAPSTSSVAVSDVRLYHAADGGEIDFEGGSPVMSDGLESYVYIALFGGNEDDPALPGDLSRQWWGNFSELKPERRLRSETQHLLVTLPPTTGNLRRIESAVKNDLAAMQTSGLARDVQVVATMPARNAIDVAVFIEVAPGVIERFNFPRSWGAR